MYLSQNVVRRAEMWKWDHAEQAFYTESIKILKMADVVHGKRV